MSRTCDLIADSDKPFYSYQSCPNPRWEPIQHSIWTEDYLHGGEETGVKYDVKIEFDIQMTVHRDVFL